MDEFSSSKSSCIVSRVGSTMIVRTYGRRNRRSPRSFSDSLNDSVHDPFSESLSQESPRDVPYSIALSSQDSSSHWSTFNSEPNTRNSSLSPSSNQSARRSFNDSRNGVVRKTKKARVWKRKVELPTSRRPSFLATSTLMEAQEFGEMMEHVNKVNFALDGLRKAQPARIIRASLLSLLSICETGQQRRLLRTQGMAKTIINSILSLNFDDSSSNLAAATLFFVLTSDGQDNHILESPSSIRFLIKLLKPIFSVAAEGKAPKIGTKLLAVCKDADFLQNSMKRVDSSSAAIISKVQDILVSCKEMKQSNGGTSGIDRPELCPKWISLLTMEKACLSTISVEGYFETTGSVRKTGGNFKEKLRELGGLDAIFEVAKNCYSDLEGWMKHSSISTLDERYERGMQILVLLLKCLEIMKNAADLSKDNQSHLLGMKGSLDPRGIPQSLPELIICIIKILSELHLLKSFPTGLNDGKYVHLSDATSNTSELNQIQDSQEHRYSMEKFSKSSIKHQKRQFSAACLENSTSTSSYMDDGSSLKMRLNSFTSSSSSDASSRSNGGASKTHCWNNFGQRKSPIIDHVKVDHLMDSQDPFAFDDDDIPSKWDVLSCKSKVIQPRKTSVKFREIENGCQSQLITIQEDSVNGDSNHCRQTPSSDGSYNEYHNLLCDCLISAVEVLMGLTYDNLVGCRQIGSCGGLETMCLLIATHFPSYSMTSSTLRNLNENGSNIKLDHHDDRHLIDQDPNFLVAILGLLINLVEKDDQNRLRLAATCVPLPCELGVEESHRDVIPLICSIFLANRGSGEGVEEGKALTWESTVVLLKMLANQGSGEGVEEGKALTWNDEAAVLQEEKEGEKKIFEGFAALLLALLSTASKSIRYAIAKHLPEQNLTSLVPVLDRFVAFLLLLNMISPETHKALGEVIESCRIL